MFRKILREREFWFLSGLTILYFFPALFGGKTFFFRDLYLFYYPQRLHFVEMIRSGQWPLWDPYVHSGMPFLGEVANLVLYPTTILYLILPTLTAFNLEIVLHVLLAGVATYALSRHLGLSRTSSLLAGGVYAFCGYSLSCINLFIRMLALPLVPLLVLFWHRFWSEQRIAWFVAAVLTAAVFILTGSIENLVMALALVAVWSLIYPYESTKSKRLIFWVLLCGFSVGLALIQILPSMETVAESARAAGYRYPVFSAWSFHPLRIPEMIFPGFFGYTDRIRADNYWALPLEHYFPYILSLYFSLAVVVLVLRAVLRKDRQEPPLLSSQFCLFLLLFSLGTLLLSFGSYLPGFSLFYKIPFVDHFRYPLKFLGGALLPIALLAAVGLERDFAFNARASRRVLVTFWIFAALLIALVIALRSEAFSARFVQSYFHTDTPIAKQGVLQSVLHAAGIWIVVTLLYQYRRISLHCWQHSLLVSVILLDLLWAGSAVNDFAPREFFTAIPNAVSLVRNQLSGGRFLRLEHPKNITHSFPEDDVLYMDRWNLETLENYSGAMYKLPLIFHEDYDGLAPRKISALGQIVWNVPAGQKKTILQISAVSVILAVQDVMLSGWDRLAVVRPANSPPFYLYKSTDLRGRAWFVSQTRIAANSEDALKQVLRSDFDPDREVILERDHPGSAGFQPVLQSCEHSPVRELSRSNTKVIYRVQSECDGYVVFSEVHYPGWNAIVDGKVGELLPANYAFSSLFVRAGSHTIERYYFPSSLLWGAFGTIATALILLFLIKSKQLQRLREEISSDAAEREIQEV